MDLFVFSCFASVSFFFVLLPAPPNPDSSSSSSSFFFFFFSSFCSSSVCCLSRLVSFLNFLSQFFCCWFARSHFGVLESVQVIIYGNGLEAACSGITLLPTVAESWVGSNVSIANIYSASDFSCTAVWSCPDCSMDPSSGSPYFVLLSSKPSWANYYNVSFQTPSLMTADPTIPDPGAFYASSVLMLPSSDMNALTGFRTGGVDANSDTARGPNPSMVFNLTPFIVYTGAASAPIIRVTLQPSVYSVSASGSQALGMLIQTKENGYVKPQVMAKTSPTSLLNGYGFALEIMLQTNTIMIVTYVFICCDLICMFNFLSSIFVLNEYFVYCVFFLFV
jgi:hypothetical protein